MLILSDERLIRTRMCADAQHDGRPAEYRWLPLWNSIPCSMPQSLADGRCSSAMQ